MLSANYYIISSLLMIWLMEPQVGGAKKQQNSHLLTQLLHGYGLGVVCS